MYKNFPYLLFFMILLLHSCANYHLNYAPEVKSWSQQESPESDLIYNVFLIGDLNEAKTNGSSLAIQALEKSLVQTTTESAVVFLGDNFPPSNLEHNHHHDHDHADDHEEEEILENLLPFIDDYDGRVFFVAGEQDWHEYGVKGLREEAHHIKKTTNKQARLLPTPGCGDPVEVKLTKDITLLLLDSQWWLENWTGEKDVNSGCEAKSRADFSFMVREAIKSNRRKQLLVAMHHPIYSKGPHGGQYSFNQHLFPLRDINDKLYVPLPIVGSAFRLLQGTIGTRQDLANATYKDLRSLLLSASTLADGVTFASAHEHSMQYWEKESNQFIISGSGAQKTASRTGNGALFAYRDYDFSKLDYYSDGQVWINYYKAIEGGDKELVFRHQVKKAKDPVPEIEPTLETEYFSDDRTSVQQLSNVDFSRTNAGQKIWGKHYRAAYNDSIEVKSLDIAALGLEPVKRGGGFQTNSLRLEHKTTERQYTLRSIDKDASRTVPYPLNSAVVLDIVTDNFSASHPLAALAVAPLAEAAGVYHSNPEVVFLPAQEALGDFNEDYADALYLFEERPDDDHWKDAAHFGSPEDVISTFDMIEEVRESHKNRIDERWTIRSRLFDLMIGDWDRHDDQWRWGKVERGKYNYYRPIPRDRDQAFANYDGFIFTIARQLSAKSKQWRPFNDKLGPTNWATYNAFLFDQSFLNNLEWKDWEEAVNYLKETMTDEVIEQAFNSTWPASFLERDAPSIISTIKGRREKLEAIALDYYKFLATEVDVLGTDQKDLFLIERINDDHTRIQIYDTNKRGEQEDLLYDRVFKTQETQRIYCYGLEDDDIFEVRGEVKMGIKIHLIGGQGKDVFDDQSTHFLVGNLNTIQDFENEKNQILNMNDSRDKRSHHPEDNLYNRRSTAYQYDFNQLLPSIGYNLDDGFLIGFGGVYTRFGYQKEPYASRHHYQVASSLNAGGSRINYIGDFIDLFGHWDFQLDLKYQTPLYGSNFYGLGNETENNEETLGLNYNHLRQRIFNISPKLSWHPNDQFQVLFGPRFRSIRIDRTPNRYIDHIGDSLDPEIFEGLELLNIETELHFNNTDVSGFPSRGINFDITAGWTTQLDDTKFDFPFVDAQLSVYQQIDPKAKLVLASRVGVQHRFTDDFPFYMGAQLGGFDAVGNFRGFRRSRFIGRTAFFHNTDLRWKMFRWNNNAIPMSIGLTASFDYGKVSLDDIESEQMHYSYGGGVFLLPFDLTTLHFGAYQGDGGQLRWLMLGGFFF